MLVLCFHVFPSKHGGFCKFNCNQFRDRWEWFGWYHYEFACGRYPKPHGTPCCAQSTLTTGALLHQQYYFVWTCGNPLIPMSNDVSPVSIFSISMKQMWGTPHFWDKLKFDGLQKLKDHSTNRKRLSCHDSGTQRCTGRSVLDCMVHHIQISRSFPSRPVAVTCSRSISLRIQSSHMFELPGRKGVQVLNN